MKFKFIHPSTSINIRGVEPVASFVCSFLFDFTWTLHSQLHSSSFVNNGVPKSISYNLTSIRISPHRIGQSFFLQFYFDKPEGNRLAYAKINSIFEAQRFFSNKLRTLP